MIPFLWLCRPVSIAPPAGAFSACCRTWCASRRKATRRNRCVISTLFSFLARRPAWPCWLVPAVCFLVGPGAAGGAVGVRDVAQAPADLRGCAGRRRVGGPGRVLVRRPVAEGL